MLSSSASCAALSSEISAWWDSLSFEAGDLGVFAEELELVGRGGVPELAGFEGDLIGEEAGGKMLLRFAVVELAAFAGVLGRTGKVLVRLPDAAVVDFPSAVPGLTGAVVGVVVDLEVVEAFAGVLGFAPVEAVAFGTLVLGLAPEELGVGEMEGLDEGRRGALRRSARAACCCFRLSMSLARGTYVTMAVGGICMQSTDKREEGCAFR